MDPHALLQCFAATLEVNQALRSQAETHLQQLSISPGFLGACLDIILAQDAPAPCKTAAAVYFKNRVVRHWPQKKTTAIDDGERPVILDRFVDVLAHVDYAMKTQLVPVLRVLVSQEYPHNWSLFLPQVAHLLQKKSDLSMLYTGVTCFAELCRYYRYVDNSERAKVLDPIIAEVFPHLRALGLEILALDLNEVLATILKLVLKCYKFCTYFDMPQVLQSRDHLVAWIDFHCNVVTLAAPSYITQSSLSPQEKAQTQVAKCYKWAVANVERLFRRYASRDLSLRFDYEEFRLLFVSECIPHLMTVFLLLIDRWCSGECWMPGPAIYHLLEFLSHCVTQKATWAILKPYFENIVLHFVYPLLCPTYETLEMFDADPHDYINLKLDNFDDLEPDVAALGLLVTFITKRKKSTLEPILQFAYATLTELAKTTETLEIARKKDGALRLLGGISHMLTAPSSPFCLQMEGVLADLVLPNLTSPHEFLQARTLDVCLKFLDLTLQNKETMSVLYNGILRAFTCDEAVSLPVSLQSALGIQAYMNQPVFREILTVIILPTMSKLLALSNETDNEIVSLVMQDCVENFAPQLQPFGVDLTKSLVEQFMRLAAEIKEAAEAESQNFDSDFNDETDDKITAAIGLLNTMVTVLLSFENSKDTLVILENIFAPMVEYVLSNDLDDFMAEVGEIIENSIFLMREVSPVLWRFLGLLANLFQNGLALMYSEELMLCLRFYMVYGSAALKQNPQFVEHLMSIILLVAHEEGDGSGYSETLQACDLAQTLILSLQLNLCIERLCKVLLPTFALSLKDKAHNKANTLMVNQINFITSCILYDAANTLRYLQEFKCLETYFERLVAMVPQIKRVFDIKITILGLCSMCTNGTVEYVPSLVPHLGPAFAVLLKELPRAIKNFEKQRTDFDAESSMPYDFDQDADEYDLDSSEVPDDPSDTAKYLEFLDGENLKYSGALNFDDEPVFEDVLGLTPLDNLDAASYFRDFSAALQASNASLYHCIFDNISDSDRQVLAGIGQAESN